MMGNDATRQPKMVGYIWLLAGLFPGVLSVLIYLLTIRYGFTLEDAYFIYSSLHPKSMSLPSGFHWITVPMTALIEQDAVILRVFGLMVTLGGTFVLSAGANSLFVQKFSLKPNLPIIYGVAAAGAMYIYTLVRANIFCYYTANVFGINTAVGAAFLVATARTSGRRFWFSVLAGLGVAFSLVGGRLVGGMEGGVIVCLLLGLTTPELHWRERSVWIGVTIGSAAVASLAWVWVFGSLNLYLDTVRIFTSVAGAYLTPSYHLEKEVSGIMGYAWHGLHSRSCLITLSLAIPILIYWKWQKYWAIGVFSLIIMVSALTQSIASHSAGAVNQQGFLVSCILGFVLAIRVQGNTTAVLMRIDRWLPVVILAVLPLLVGLGSMAAAVWGASDNFTPWLILVGAAMSVFISSTGRGIWMGLIAVSLVVITAQPLEVLVMKRWAYLTDILGNHGGYPLMDGIPVVGGFRVTVEEKAYADGIRRLIAEATADGRRYRVMNLDELGIETQLSGLTAFGEVLTQAKWGVGQHGYNDDLTCRFLARNPLLSGEKVVLITKAGVSASIRSCLARDHHLNFPESFSETGTLSSPFLPGVNVTVYQSH